MMVYIDDDEPMFVEQLGLDDARAVLSRTRASLPWAFNSAHAVALRAEIAAVEDQIDWLETQQNLIKCVTLPNYLQAYMDPRCARC